MVGGVSPNRLRHNVVPIVATTRFGAALPPRAPRAHPSVRCSWRVPPRAVTAPVGAPSRDRRRQRDVNLCGWMTVNLHGGKVFGFIRIGQPVNFRLPPERRQCDHAVMQGNTATQNKIAAVGVGAG